jgi:alpha-D-ribose 1-methylphosphonate 5-triphosphate diphosphatase PhnM
MQKEIKAHGKTVTLRHEHEYQNPVPAIRIHAQCGQTTVSHTMTFGAVDHPEQPLITAEELRQQVDAEKEKIAKIAAHREHMRELRDRLIADRADNRDARE